MANAADERRVRTHLIYGFGENKEAPGYLFPMHEYRVSGHPYDASAWQPVGTHLPRNDGASSD